MWVTVALGRRNRNLQKDGPGERMKCAGPGLSNLSPSLAVAASDDIAPAPAAVADSGDDAIASCYLNVYRSPTCMRHTSAMPIVFWYVAGGSRSVPMLRRL